MSYPFTFTNMGATGQYGPTSISYGTSTPGYGTSNVMTLSGGIQYWTVPQTGYYQFIAAGGGSGATSGTSAPAGGVIVSTTVLLTAGQILKILVGQVGLTGPPNYAAGGGGTFIAFVNNIPILVAGGAGGSWGTGTSGPQGNGQLTTSGGNGYAGGSGGANGSGGNVGNNNQDGGAGYFTNTGTTDTRANFSGATAFIAGGLGGYENGAAAGFGGGSGGGGGYSGGSGLTFGGQGNMGGGGSYDINNAANSYTATLYTGVSGFSTGYNKGPGFAIVNYLGPS